MPNVQGNKDLNKACIIGLGLLGGSLGLAISRVMPDVKVVGYSHRQTTCERAVAAGVVDESFDSVASAVVDCDLVILASPISTFETLMSEMAGSLATGCIVTDVGSTKVLPVRWARNRLPKHVHFLGSHPMAGSEQRGVDFARADLFDDANCIVTPTASTDPIITATLTHFWQVLGMKVSQMAPAEHDRVLARISHLPHALATALVNSSEMQEIVLCGKGFLDTTRIASGPPGVWRDILMSNAANTSKAIGKLIKELQRAQKMLDDNDGEKMTAWLADAQAKRNELVERKLKRKELPA